MPLFLTEDRESGAQKRSSAHPEQLEGETDKAYDAFCIWLNLGLRRTYKRVAQRLKYKSDGQIRRWATQHRWQARKAPWDRSIIDRTRQLAAERQRELMARTYLARLNDWGAALDSIDDVRDALIAIATGDDAELKGDGPEDGGVPFQVRLKAIEAIYKRARLDDAALLAALEAEPGESRDDVNAYLRRLLGRVSVAAAEELLAAIEVEEAGGDDGAA